MKSGDQCRCISLVGLSLQDQPRNPVFAGVLDFPPFLRLDMRLTYDLCWIAE